MHSITHTNNNVLPFKTYPTRRKIFSYNSNATASLAKESVAHLKTAIQEHSALRMQLFYVKALAVWQKAARTEGSPAKPLVWVGKARTQGGRSKTKGTHAAHADANAGLTDNRRDLIIEELIVEQRITPIKKKLLKTIGFTDIDMENIHSWIDGTMLSDESFFLDLEKRFYKLEKLFQTRWPHLSMIEGTQIEVTASATTALPRSLNLQCDKPLELATRPKAALLYKKCMQGMLSPRKVSTQYVQLVQTHFSIVKQNLSGSIQLFGQFTLHARKVFLYESTQNPRHCNGAWHLTKVQSFWIHLRKEKIGVPKMLLPLSERYFVRGGGGESRQRMVARLSTLRKRKVTLEGLEAEWAKYKQLLQDLFDYASWEKEGSVLPDLRTLVRYTSPRSKKVRTPTKEEALDMSWSLLQPAPKTPTASRRNRRLSLSHCK